MSEPEPQNFDVILDEQRTFAPPPGFAERARIGSRADYEKEYAWSVQDPQAYWSHIAEQLHWFRRWDQVLDASDAPDYRWFSGGRTNLCYNCLDRHLATPVRNQAALLWEGEPGDRRVLTYQQLHREVCRFANALKGLGIERGDRVALYLPMIPELVVAVLACARIGAVHTVIFAGFSAEAIRGRVEDCQARCVITADGGWRKGSVLSLKNTVDEALEQLDCVRDVVIVKRASGDPFPCRVKEGRDHWYHRLVQEASPDCPCAEMEAEELLFLLYTSGTTGKPKGIVHTTGGYMVYSYLTFRYVFDHSPEDIYWCTADVGWITGHSYIVYGPLQNGATQLLYEGAPNYPDNGRFWNLIETYGVNTFYTAPTAIRAFMKWGDTWPQQYDLSSLRLLGTVGEPINPEAWMWYHRVIGGERCPIVDTWWQTETGGIALSPLPGAIPTKPGSATLPFPGIVANILDEAGNPAEAGLLAIQAPWPGMLRGIYGDPERFRATYWSQWGGRYYFPGDGARRDADGYFWILGRVDDVVNVSGHRIGTAELESIFVEHPDVVESAVIGTHHDLKGQCLVSFVTVRSGTEPDEALSRALNAMVVERIGKFACPERIIYTADLPKTRSGKIMRRLLRDIAEGRALGNVTTLADPSIVEALKAQYAEN